MDLIQKAKALCLSACLEADGFTGYGYPDLPISSGASATVDPPAL